MKKSTIKLLLVTLYFAFVIQGCSNSDSSNNEQKDTATVSQTTDTGLKKVNAFNDVNELVNKLSGNGIGDLKPWQNPFDMGYGSLTDYFAVGKPKVEYGLPNNVAYYLEGTKTKANNVLINLNINNPVEKKLALGFLSDLTAKTFASLRINAPVGLLKSIKAGKAFKAENTDFTTSFKLEKSKIETWKLLIVSK